MLHRTCLRAPAAYLPPACLPQDVSGSAAASEEAVELGWQSYSAPRLQQMGRRAAAEPATAPSWMREVRRVEAAEGAAPAAGGVERSAQSARQVAVLQEEAPGRLRVAPRAWSVAY